VWGGKKVLHIISLWCAVLLTFVELPPVHRARGAGEWIRRSRKAATAAGAWCNASQTIFFPVFVWQFQKLNIIGIVRCRSRRTKRSFLSPFTVAEICHS
jgi:hypothetical protein